MVRTCYIKNNIMNIVDRKKRKNERNVQIVKVDTILTSRDNRGIHNS